MPIITNPVRFYSKIPTTHRREKGQHFTIIHRNMQQGEVNLKHQHYTSRTKTRVVAAASIHKTGSRTCHPLLLFFIFLHAEAKRAKASFSFFFYKPKAKSPSQVLPSTAPSFQTLCISSSKPLFPSHPPTHVQHSSVAHQTGQSITPPYTEREHFCCHRNQNP